MLPRRNRIRSSRDFAATVRHGRRASAGRVVVYLVSDRGDRAPRVGLIVSRQVGNSVTRHRVARILRHAVCGELATLQPGATLVLRALPGAAERDSELARDVRVAVARVGGGAP